jgi:hypothetical protein
LVGIAAALAEADVPVVAFKGPALSQQVYGDAGLRIFCDLDLLVPAARVGRAREVLLGAGYRDVRPLDGVSPERLLAAMQEVVLHDARTDTLVELHWREGPRFAADSLPSEGIIGRAGTVEILGRPISVPAPADTALLVAVHATTHDWLRYEDVAALCAALHRLSPDDERCVLTTAARHGCRRRLHVGVLLAVGAGAAAPSPALWRSASADRGARRLAAVYRARLCADLRQTGAEPAPTPFARAGTIVREACGMDSPAAGAKYLGRRLVTPGVNDWEAGRTGEGGRAGVKGGDAAEQGHGDGAGRGDMDGAVRSRLGAIATVAATQLRRQRRLWRRRRRAGRPSGTGGRRP